MLDYLKLVDQCKAKSNIKLHWIDKILRRTLESKLDNHCHYTCSLKSNTNHMKLNGRYPYRETIFCTEFFSALFSLLNLIAHFYYHNKFIKKKLEYSKLKALVKMQYYIVICLWTASTLFHVNDIYVTRCADYFLATTFLMFAFYYSFIRTLCFYRLDTKFIKITLGTHLFVLYVFYLYYMTVVEFHYVFSKFFCVIFLVLTLCTWAFQYYKLRKSSYAKNIMIYSYSLILGGLLEARDIPPIFYLIDSHSLWHLITALAAPFYYAFLEKDILHESVFIKEKNL